jgi:dTDP-4-amino-4,6-dideoxygalactose transaminase
VDEINALGREKGIPVIDDCIEAFGAEYKGRIMGSLGTDVTLLSFQTVRLPNTIDGGAVCFRDAALHRKACRLRDLGVDRATFRDAMGEISPASDVETPGIGVTMNEVASYIGGLQMERIGELLARQRANAGMWREKLSAGAGCHPLGRDETLPNYWVFGLLADRGREAAIRRFRGTGLWASSVHLPNNNYSVFGDKGGHLPGTKEFYSRFVALPCGWWVD